jgi:glutaminase
LQHLKHDVFQFVIPRNPFTNVCALVINDRLAQRSVQADIGILQFLRMLSAEPKIDFDQDAAKSEERHAHRNSAIAHLMKYFGNLHHLVVTVIASYCRQCSMTMSCLELARAGGFLASQGTILWNHQKTLDSSSAMGHTRADQSLRAQPTFSHTGNRNASDRTWCSIAIEHHKYLM